MGSWLPQLMAMTIVDLFSIYSSFSTQSRSNTTCLPKLINTRSLVITPHTLMSALVTPTLLCDVLTTIVNHMCVASRMILVPSNFRVGHHNITQLLGHCILGREFSEHDCRFILDLPYKGIVFVTKPVQFVILNWQVANPRVSLADNPNSV